MNTNNMSGTQGNQNVAQPFNIFGVAVSPNPKPKPSGVPGRPLLTQIPIRPQGPAPRAAPIPLVFNPIPPRVVGSGWPLSMQRSSKQASNFKPVEAKPSTIFEGKDAPIFVDIDTQDVKQQYSPSDVYAESTVQDPADDSEDNESSNHSGQKRMSAFQRLGPITQPKKPKLTINLTLNKEQSVREVVDETEEQQTKYCPVHLREDILTSTDDTVMKFLIFWPWRKNVQLRKTVTARSSKSVMILEQEQMEELYEKDNVFFQVKVRGYPSSWSKEDVLDAVLECAKGYSFIPCFTEFNKEHCKFLCLRSRAALVSLHKTGFIIRKDEVELSISISSMFLSLNQIDFIPRLILRKRVAMGYDNHKLDLSYFTLKEDISHFLYFPLNRVCNQTELVQLQSIIDWSHLTTLNLSRNRISDISGFDLKSTVPRLKHLNLSFNNLERITVLISCKGLPLKSIHLEGNPLCTDYTDPDHYIKVIKMLFTEVNEIDGELLHPKGELPTVKQNYCHSNSKELTEKFIERYFPLLDNDREIIQGMYYKHAVLNITYSHKLRLGTTFRSFSNLFLFARTGLMDEGDRDPIEGDGNIMKLLKKWPRTEHDPLTFTVDVMYQSDFTTILRIGGILKLAADTLADDEQVLTFARTVLLHSADGVEYKIYNEMLYWDLPTPSYARTAFRVTTVQTNHLKVESTNDDNLKDGYLRIFMKLTSMDQKFSERCLQLKNWNLKEALEYFTKQLRLDNLDSIMNET